MTRHRSFKRLVRARMDKTGESYTAARAMVLAGEQPPLSLQPPVSAQPAGAAAPPHAPEPAPVVPLATSDEAIRRRTGRGWEEWFDLLDEWGAAERTHREIAIWVAEQLGVVPLAWGAQAVTMSYERARGGRAVGEHPDGFTVTASRTVAVAVDELFAAFADEAVRERWLPGAPLRLRSATEPRSVRFDWDAGPTRVHVTFAPNGARSTVVVQHTRLSDADVAAERKRWWRVRLIELKAALEGGDHDA